MTIHRMREGSPPDGGPEPGRQIVQIGNIFVEYTGQVPTQADLDARDNARAADKAAKQANKDAANGHPDSKPVTWGELRPILVDAGVLDQ